jgi:hypothetical protein
MQHDERPAAEATVDPEGVEASTLAAALEATVQSDGREPPTLRLQQRVAFAEGLIRRGTLDLSARCFRSTLWAGEHRCLDHVELAEVQRITADVDNGRLAIESSSLRVVLTRQGTLSVVPAETAGARARRRAGDQASEPDAGQATSARP